MITQKKMTACCVERKTHFLAGNNKFMLTKRRPVGPQVKWPWPKWRSKFTFIAAKRYEAIIVRLFIDGLAACFPAAQHMHRVRSGNSGRLYFKVDKTVPLPPYCSHAVCKYPMFDFLINELSNLLGQSPVCICIFIFLACFRFVNNI